MNEREKLLKIIVEHPELAVQIQGILLEAMNKTLLLDPLEEAS